MKIGYKVLVTEDYYGDEDYKKEKLLVSKGDYITVEIFSKKDFEYNRRDCTDYAKWYLEFEELDGCFSFPNDYMNYDEEFNRIKEIDKILK